MINLYKTLAASAILLTLISCGRAGARTDMNKHKNSGKVIELNTEEFKQKVYDISDKEPVYLGDKPAIVDFTATWCGPCRRIAPVLDELAIEYADHIVIYKVDIDKNRELAKMLNISSIPAILYIPSDGMPVMTAGARSKDRFKSEIDSILLAE
ncbi:MAG: thioredoxin fold domain-containing protein [Bacteroidales bacterium]|nr:thioredoxin fold domain-containing protein [Bacteroidales bacterium]